jgi:hypothetical protein
VVLVEHLIAQHTQVVEAVEETVLVQVDQEVVVLEQLEIIMLQRVRQILAVVEVV